jgi:hypothetical protein
MNVVDLGTQGQVEIGAEKGHVFINAYRSVGGQLPISYRLSADEARKLRDELTAALDALR